MSTSPTDDPIITLVEGLGVVGGRYHNPKRIGGPIREGYFSLLFEAWDAEARQKVALKFFDLRHSRDQYRRDGFSREAKLLAEFCGQPNILQLLAGEQEFQVPVTTLQGIQILLPMAYFVTELAPGSLKHFIYSGANNPHDALVFFREVCKGVQRIHNVQVCHRDLKPDNCLIFPGRVAKICDFGTARHLREVTLLPRYDAPVGDRRYTALELFCGLGNDPRCFFPADMFSLGAILFELFTRQVLTQFIYNFRILDDLGEFFARSVPDSQREERFQLLLPKIRARSSLPELATLDNTAPSCIRDRVNSLYMRLSDLDYRSRATVSFIWIFREIEICLKILQNEEKYRRWMEQRRRFRRTSS
jgi:serine/threonine protein kinase